MDPLTVTIVGGLVVAAVTGTVSYGVGKFHGRTEFEKKCEANIVEYVETLQKIIEEANHVSPDDFESFIRKAAAIVAQRNDFKSDLDDLSKLLNTEIDELGELVRIDNEADLRGLEKRMRRLVSVIADKWPGKQPLIASKMRSLLAKWGIFGRQ